MHPGEKTGPRLITPGESAAAPEGYRIVYLDEQLAVVCKPPGIHVHPSPLSPGEPAVLQGLRDQLGRRVWPLHRLDRPTSGLLAFALDAASASRLGEDFRGRRVRKLYAALVRGWFPEELAIDSALDAPDGGPARDCRTACRCLEEYEIPQPLGPYQTVRASLVACEPEGGRRHQIRRHLARSGHPIVGDSGYGDLRHNRYHAGANGLAQLQLYAVGLGFRHPASGQWLSLRDDGALEAGGPRRVLAPYLTRRLGGLPERVAEPLAKEP